MDRREFNAALGAAALSGLFATDAHAQQQRPAVRKPVVGMVVHSDMILLDLAGPLTAFNTLQTDIHLIGKSKQPVTTDVGLPVTPTDSFETASRPGPTCASRLSISGRPDIDAQGA
jgi:cyclohexyl-isocyanide hydratase